MLGYQRTDEHWFQMSQKFKVVHVCIMLQDEIYQCTFTFKYLQKCHFILLTMIYKQSYRLTESHSIHL